MNVFINPGHAPNGNPDPGAVNGNTGLRECDVALAVGDLVAHYLKAAGVGVTNVFQCDSLEEICDQANASGADLFIYPLQFRRSSCRNRYRNMGVCRQLCRSCSGSLHPESDC